MKEKGKLSILRGQKYLLWVNEGSCLTLHWSYMTDCLCKADTNIKRFRRRVVGSSWFSGRLQMTDLLCEVWCLDWSCASTQPSICFQWTCAAESYANQPYTDISHGAHCCLFDDFPHAFLFNVAPQTTEKISHMTTQYLRMYSSLLLVTFVN